VTGDAVDGFDIAAKAFGAARIEQQASGGHARGDRIGVEQSAVVERNGIMPGYDRFDAVVGRQAQRRPARETAIEHSDACVPGNAQQPPQARRECAVTGVIDNDLHVRRHAVATEPVAEVGGRWPGMAPSAQRMRAGQVAVEVRVARAGDVRFLPGAFAGGGIVQCEAAVEDAQIGIVQVRRQRFGIDERGPGGHAASVAWRPLRRTGARVARAG
jgi:hypothetical protein